MPDEELSNVPLGEGAGARNIAYRKGSSDERSINHVFERQDYNLRILQRWDEIATFLNRQHGEGKRPLVVDAGANIGAATLFFGLLFPRARIVAIEPEAENFRLLEKNTQGLDVKLERAALSSKSGYSQIEEAPGGYWAFRTSPAEEPTLGVPNITLNEIYERECSDEVFPFLVKMDVEGAEEDVFSGGLEWFDRTSILILEPHDWIMPRMGTARNFLREIANRDRDFIVEIENVFSIKYVLG